MSASVRVPAEAGNGLSVSECRAVAAHHLACLYNITMESTTMVMSRNDALAVLTTICMCSAFAVQGGAMLECGGLVTEKVAGWRFEASE